MEPGQNKILFIYNPTSGPVGKRMTRDKLHGLLLEAGVQGDIEQTNYAGHAPVLALAASKNGYNTIVAVGGDGTVNEIAGVLRGTPVKLGIIPRGSGNGLARHLGIPMDAQKAMGVIKQNFCITIDSGQINGKPFFCTAGIGFDGYISGIFAASQKRGLATYAQLVLRNFSKYKPVEAKISTSSNQFSTSVFVMVFANAAQYGNNMFIAPMANVQDGSLDMGIIRSLNLSAAVKLGYGLLNKSLSNSSYINYQKITRVVAEFAEPCAFHTDGEYVGNAQKFEVEILSASLHVIKTEH